ncbi:MAG: TetR/AcrR family transcriptional regulator [Candidatus Thiodiazotropha sp. (ex Monitilora ramsayi)]|nr:TetR/AcrR family transcriptional regulator [Candidatus Thiodiazotropha sp. (ex Monitilora ramsayi)]
MAYILVGMSPPLHHRQTTSADDTRLSLLEAAYDEIHHYGFQAASLNAILQRTGVTKGALYHHFSSKLQLGYAVLDEAITHKLESMWFEPMQRPGDAVDILIDTIRQAGEYFGSEEIALGCPLNNLAQEMSPIDDGFRQRIDVLYQRWQQNIINLLTRGQHENCISKTINVTDTALFILASLEGCMSMAKNAQSHDVLMSCGEGLLHYLESLRASPDK